MTDAYSHRPARVNEHQLKTIKEPFVGAPGRAGGCLMSGCIDRPPRDPSVRPNSKPGQLPWIRRLPLAMRRLPGPGPSWPRPPGIVVFRILWRHGDRRSSAAAALRRNVLGGRGLLIPALGGDQHRWKGWPDHRSR